MRRLLLSFCFLLVLFTFRGACGQVALSTSPYTQDFNSLVSSGTGTWSDNTTITGWYTKTDLTSSITTCNANTGSTTTAGLYSFGTTSVIDRALGYVPSNAFFGAAGTGKGYLGLRLKNNTGSPITSLTIVWTGEQWRKENNAASHSLALSYQTGSIITDLTAGTWTSTGSTFTSPIIGATTATALDGNAAANRTAAITKTITVTLAAGNEIMLRWEDLNDSGNDHQLAIDDVSVAFASDATAPAFTSGYPKTANTTDVQFDLVVNLNEQGKVYYVVLADGASSPSAAQVRAGQDNSGTPVSNSGAISVTSSAADFSKAITGLSPSTNYDVYTVAEDAVLNLQTSPTKIDVTTNVSTTPFLNPSIASISFSGFTDKSKGSSSQSYTLSANNLTTDVVVAVSGNFLISSDDATFSTSLNILASAFSSPQTIYVKFNPSGNVGTQAGTINHSSTGAIDKSVSLSAAAIDPFSQNFNDPAFLTNSGWTQYSVTGAQVWGSTNFGHTCLTGCNNATADKAAQINGFSGSSQTNEDWLISPQLDLTSFMNYPALSFATISAFAGDALQLKYSINYSGTGDPSVATWTPLDGKFPVSNSSIWTTSSNIILPKSIIYVAFIYTSNTIAASRWTLDDWKVEDISSYLNIPSINFSFGEVAVGGTSASQSFTLNANGYGDITISAPTAFEVSLDNNVFHSSLIVTQADASAGKTIYVRFTPPTKQLKWAGAITFIGTNLNSSSGLLSGSSYPKSETFNVATYNMEFFGTDVKDAKNVEFGPTDDALQVTNVATVLQTIGADIYGVEEISDDNAFNQLVSNLSGYDKILSDRWSYSWQAADPNFPPQKIGFIYNTSKAQLISSRVMFAAMYDSILAGTKSLPNYPTGTSSSFWSSGRLPFMATFDITINGTKRRIRMIDIHGKSASDTESYNRRVYDNKVLHDSLIAHYPHDNIILLGDFNDKVYGSITTSAVSSYEIFVDDSDNFKAITYDLNVGGASTFPSSASFIDNVIISNELVNAYVANSVTVEDPRGYINNYSTTTSDHLPVSSRFLLSAKADQAITFSALPPKIYGDANFILTATASSELPVSFTSSDPTKVSLNGNVATILKAGSVTITASQTGSDDFNAAVNVDQSLVINKADQTITFSTITDKTVGNASFPLAGSSTSGLAITFGTTSDKVTIATNQVSITKAGRLTITASQAGNENYNAATPVDRSFCINPSKPVITITNALTATPTLTSSISTGNQWYLGGNTVVNATGSSLTVNTQGTYKVQAHTDDCFSEFSSDAVIVITEIEKAADREISLSPNPADDYIFIAGAERQPQLFVSDFTGKTFNLVTEKYNEGHRVYVRDFSSGIYIVRLLDGNSIRMLKFIKK